MTREQVEQIVAEYLNARETPDPAAYPVGTDGRLGSFFRNGLVLESANRDFRVRVGGLTQFDTNWFNNDPQIGLSPFLGGVGAINDSVEFRRARLRVEGAMYDVIDWVAEYDFATVAAVSGLSNAPPGAPILANTPSITDVYARVTQLPVVGNFQIGNFTEPLGFENMTNVRYQDFLERSHNEDVFYGPFNYGYGPGMMLFNWTQNERMTWALWGGVNQSNPYGYHIGDGQYAGTVRLTYLPFYDAGGRYLIHFGGSASRRSPDQGQFRARARGEIMSGPQGANPNYADTGSLGANNQSIINLEFAAVWGPLTVQAEYAGEWVDGLVANQAAIQQIFINPGATGYFGGGYIEAMWFLTGEHRGYNRQRGVFDRVVPYENFYFVRGANGCPIFGRGAWQIGGRFSTINLNTAGVNGGILDSYTLGLNWYLNPNMKVQWNYDLTHRTSVGLVGAGYINSFGMRVALDF